MPTLEALAPHTCPTGTSFPQVPPALASTPGPLSSCCASPTLSLLPTQQEPVLFLSNMNSCLPFLRRLDQPWSPCCFSRTLKLACASKQHGLLWGCEFQAPGSTGPSFLGLCTAPCSDPFSPIPSVLQTHWPLFTSFISAPLAPGTWHVPHPALPALSDFPSPLLPHWETHRSWGLRAPAPGRTPQPPATPPLHCALLAAWTQLLGHTCCCRGRAHAG